MYSPIAVSAVEFDAAGDRAELTVVNRFSHRSFEGLEVRVTGGALEAAPALAIATRRDDAAGRARGRPLGGRPGGVLASRGLAGGRPRVALARPDGRATGAASWNVPISSASTSRSPER